MEEKDAIIKELLDVVRFYANQKNWKMTSFGSAIINNDLTQVVEVDYIDRYGGKKARKCLDEIEPLLFPWEKNGIQE